MIGQFDEIFGRPFALSAAAKARIDERVQADMRGQTGAARRHFARQLRQAALRQRIGLDCVGGGHALDRRRVDQRAADHALQQAGMRQMADAAVGAVAEPHRMHRGQIARLAFGQKAPGDRRDQRVGHGMSGAGTADQQRIAAGDQLRCFIGGDDTRRHLRYAATPRPRSTSTDAIAKASRPSLPNTSLNTRVDRIVCNPLPLIII